MYYAFRATVEGQKITFLEANNLQGKYEAIVLLTIPLNQEVDCSANQSSSFISHSVSKAENTMPPAGFLLPKKNFVTDSNSNEHSEGAMPRVSLAKDNLPSAAAQYPLSVNKTLSLLYNDKTSRDLRRESNVGDIYVNVNATAYQRFMQGEQVPLIFEEGGNYLNSPFILVENKTQLYLNFHQFNEGKPLPLDMLKLLIHIFDVKGSLPDFVKSSRPATVNFQNGGFIIVSKGVLWLSGSS